MCGGSEISFEAAFIFCCFCCCQNPGKIRIVTWRHPFYHHQYCHTSLIWLGQTIDLISTIFSLLPLFPSSIPGTVCGHNNCVVPYSNVDSTKCVTHLQCIGTFEIAVVFCVLTQNSFNEPNQASIDFGIFLWSNHSLRIESSCIWYILALHWSGFTVIYSDFLRQTGKSCWFSEMWIDK